jgi:hypothetical protein
MGLSYTTKKYKKEKTLETIGKLNSAEIPLSL